MNSEIQWFEKPLGEVTCNHDGKRKPVKESERKKGPYPYYGASGIVDYVDGYLFDGRYLLIAEDGENLRTRQTPIAFMADGKFWVNNHAHIVTGNEEVTTEYLHYFLQYADIQSYLTGAVMPKLTQGNLNRIPVRYPEPDYQKQIVQVLSFLDRKIDLNRRINQTLEAMAQAIFQSWFVDFNPVKAKIAAIEQGQDPLRAAMRAISGTTDAELDQMPREHHDQLAATAALFPDAMKDSELGEIPKGWEISDFGSVSTCLDKNRIPLSKRQREDKKGNIPYYGATSVMDYVDEHIFDGVFLLLGEDGSVLREDGTPFVQYIWGKAWVNNHAHVLQGSNGISTEQLMLFISMENISAYVTGAVQLKLNQKNMNSIPFIKAAKDVNSRFSELIIPLYAKYRSVVEEIRGLTDIRDTLLPKLLSGELSVVDMHQEVTA